jgi:hypothetical protein
MALQPGQSTTVTIEFMMHGDMGGPHEFRIHLLTNDPSAADRELTVLSNWVP